MLFRSGKCPSPGDNHPEFGGVCHLNFTSGPAKGRFCWERQPEWSAFRESSFGHGILEVIKLLHCLLLIINCLDVLEGNAYAYFGSLLLIVITCEFIQVLNSTYALWTWHRNQDTYGEDSVGDQIYIVRQPDKCLVQPTSVTSPDW